MGYIGMRDLLFVLKRIYWFIRRPRTQGVKCIIEKDGEILMIRRTFGTDKWVFPGGGIKSGESPEDAIRREIEEDLGVAPRFVRKLGEFTQRVHYRNETIHCFSSTFVDINVQPDTGKIADVK